MMRSTYPMLRVGDDATLDWREAEYRASVRFVGSEVRVSQEITGCDQLSEYVKSGVACWAIELRSPSTLYAEVHELNDAEATLPLKTDEIGDILYAIPGLVSKTELHLDASSLTSLWADTLVAIPPGTWIARGQIHSNKDRVQSLIAFDLDPQLASGTMRIADPQGDDDIRFTVYLAPDLYQHTGDRTVRHTALAGAFARLPRIARRNPEPGTGAHRQLAAIAEKLGEHVASWESEDDYDPILAATCFEPLAVLPELEESE